MSNITKLEFAALDISGKNYLSWVLDAELYLSAKSLGDTIVADNTASQQDRSKALIFLRHHIHEGLKTEYLTVKDPLIMWNNLKERYEPLRNIMLPKARHEWILLRFQDFKSVSAYNSALFKITSMLKLCNEKITDEDMLEKTYSTFHASNVLLQQQYRERGFTKYSELISCLLLAEQNNEILMKNHLQRPTGSAPLPEAGGNTFPEVNVVTFHGNPCGRGRGHGRGRGCGRGHGRGHGQNNTWHHQDPRPVSSNMNKRARVHHDMGRHGRERQENAPVDADRAISTEKGSCYRCGASDHWVRTCRTPRHLVDLYQASMKEKAEINHVEFDKPLLEFEVNDTFAPSVGDFMAPIGDFDADDEEPGST